jgi:hypothetical protein
MIGSRVEPEAFVTLSDEVVFPGAPVVWQPARSKASGAMSKRQRMNPNAEQLFIVVSG